MKEENSASLNKETQNPLKQRITSYHKESKEDDSTTPNIRPAPVVLLTLKHNSGLTL